MTNPVNPYRGLSKFQYWTSGVADIGLGKFDPVEAVKFQIGESDHIATLGSCFAQHLAKHISKSGYNYVVTEPLRNDEEQTEIAKIMASQFSARYGNVYTVRQALQLLDRANGWEPKDSIWERDGKFYDAFRPNVVPGGFASEEKLIEERKRHLASVLRVFTQSDVVVFTLGLTETWMSLQDGAVYPVAPGVVAGSMNESQYEFKNFNYTEVMSDLTVWCKRLREMNPKVRILLTVSPVPLNATYELMNVWTSTTYSKATLRAVAGDVATALPYVDYFPSYEIVTCPQVQGRYFEDDLREVKEIGVQHVMRVFGKHYLASSKTDEAVESKRRFSLGRSSRGSGVSNVFCDEELLDQEE